MISRPNFYLTSLLIKEVLHLNLTCMTSLGVLFTKQKTGCQWEHLFVDLECVKYPFSWQTVYYYHSKWIKAGVYEKAFLPF